MRFIRIDPRTLEVRIQDEPSDHGFLVPTDLSDHARVLAPIERMVSFGVLYRARYKDDSRSGVRSPRYRLPDPDPWLVALAYVMWQGILQGLAWEAVKMAAQRALEAMRTEELAPKPTHTTHNRTSRTELGFSWTSYAYDGRKLYHLFVGLRRVQRSQPIEQSAVASVCPPQSPKTRNSRRRKARKKRE